MQLARRGPEPARLGTPAAQTTAHGDPPGRLAGRKRRSRHASPPCISARAPIPSSCAENCTPLAEPEPATRPAVERTMPLTNSTTQPNRLGSVSLAWFRGRLERHWSERTNPPAGDSPSHPSPSARVGARRSHARSGVPTRNSYCSADLALIVMNLRCVHVIKCTIHEIVHVAQFSSLQLCVVPTAR